MAKEGGGGGGARRGVINVYWTQLEVVRTHLVVLACAVCAAGAGRWEGGWERG